MKQSIKEVRIAEDPLSYLRHLSRIVFGNMFDVAREFTKLFAGNPGCCSGSLLTNSSSFNLCAYLLSVLLFWGSGEIKTFVQLVLRHIFEPGPSLSVLGQCVSSIFDQCAEVRLVIYSSLS